MSSDRRVPSPQLADTQLADTSYGPDPQPLERGSGDATIAEARAAVADYVTAHCPWVSPQGVVLAVSELVSNAIRHADGWWLLRVRAGEEELAVEIEDRSPAPPEPRRPDYTGEGGLGLHIVARLVSRFEVEAGVPAGGKTVRAVWCREADEPHRLTAQGR
ncbi:ATP-binding protein [Actinospica robiniae]|uniref:ATP-binding protein n=1 Tax=Actinospica robiniae TaxID=304901 RepID=UPI00068909D0|nr:ATP-binding protein [Actinospica robiniae]